MTEMLPPQRQQQILTRLQAAGSVRVTELTALLGVSDMTVRRDLNILAERGALVKVHGGATLSESATSLEPGFLNKLDRDKDEKRAIARLAASTVEPGMAIALNSGTTTFATAQECVGIPNLTVVTNSPRIAEVFYAGGNDSHTVILTGGIRTPSDALVGPLAVASLQRLHVDLCFMGVHGLTLQSGFTTPNMLEAQTNQAFIESAAHLVVVADHTKWGLTGLCHIAELSTAEVLITDSKMPDGAIEELRQHIDEVLVADESGARSR